MPQRPHTADLSNTVRQRKKKEKSWRDRRFDLLEEQPPVLVRWAMKYSRGYITTQRQAYAVLWAIAGTTLLGAVIIFLSTTGPAERAESYAPDTEYGGRILPDTAR